jgi:Asp-tRNA(Asn)/Glu-tRNA(Gln) amidotransferase A subunit family amidase
MTDHSPLASTISGLRRSLRQNELSIPEALAHQAHRLAVLAREYQCIVHQHALPQSPRTEGPLAGIGLAHKDIFETANRRPAAGSARSLPGCPSGNAPVVEQLAQAGAVNLAALAMTEFACGATGENPNGPEPVNPLDPAAAVGGSSSGSAVAVAAGLCYASLGTDTAGSVRIPAATCGIVGLKPTYDLISRRGVFPLAGSLDCIGILARSAADAAQVLAAVSAPLPSSLSSSHAALQKAGADPDRIEQYLLAPRRWRINTHLALAELDADVAAALAAFVQSLAPMARLREVSLPGMEGMTQYAQTLLHAEAAGVHREVLTTAPASLAPITRAVTMPGVAIPPEWVAQARARRSACARAFADDCLADADLLLVPALPRGIPDWSAVHTRSPQFDPRELLALHRWMPFVNYLGFPAIVFPVGFDRRQRPVCIQAIARPYCESALLSLTYQIERAFHGTAGFPAAARLDNH